MPCRIAAALLLAALLPAGLCAEGSAEPEPYREHEFPQWARDMRHSEVVTLGSLPFTMLGVTFGYGLFQYATGATSSFPNPLDKSGGYDMDDIKLIVGLSLGVSVALGMADLAITLGRRRHAAHRLRQVQESAEHATVLPMTREEAEALRQENGGEDGSESADVPAEAD